MSNKILVNTPSLKELGGVANHFLGMKPFLRDKCDFHVIGTRHNIPGLILLPFDLLSFIFKLTVQKYRVIVLNPSLNKNAILRDYLFLCIAKYVFRKRVILFIHGWNEDYAKEVSLNKKHIFLKCFIADKIFVLCSVFKDELRQWGYQGTVSLLTTKHCIVKIPMVSKIKNRLLFMARVTEAKGIFIALKAFLALREMNSSFELIIIGEGPALSLAKEYAEKLCLQDVIFTGRLNGEVLYNKMSSCGAYIFPSFHGEGMPTSVLEAMALGLPVITTPNAGIKDFFIEGEMGYFCEMHSVESLTKSILKLYANEAKFDHIASFNLDFAKRSFSASVVAEKFLDEVLS